MTAFLGLDIGTQGVKVLLLDPERGPLDVAARPLTTLEGLPQGHSEQHPADWIDAVRGALADLRARAPADFRRIAAIGVSGQQHGLVALDAGHDVIRPAMLWNDVRCAAECREIVASLGGAAGMFASTGLASLPPGFTAGKLRWLFRHEPASFARLRHVLLPHDYVDLWLTGRLTAEAGDASGTGMLDVRARRYHDAACEAVAPGARGLLAPLCGAGDAIGTLRDELACELDLPHGVLVAAGGGDNMMAAIGAGAVEPGVAAMSLGTSGTIFAFADQPICDSDGEIAPFCDSTGHWLPLGCTMNATVATEAARALFGRDLGVFETEVARVPVGCDGVACVPFFTGERSPDLPTATASFHGLGPRNTTAAHLERAAMEGATFALARLLDRLRDLGMVTRELRLTGGGSRSATWRRIVAAACDATVRVGIHPDAAALGAAIQAGWTWRRDRGEHALTLAAHRRSLKLDDALGELVPSPDEVEAYCGIRAHWQHVVDAVTTTFPETL